MFSETALYQYGSNPDNTVTLPIKAAEVMNKIRITEELEQHGEFYVKTNLSAFEMKVYDRTASFLNDYIDAKGGAIDCYEGYLDNHDMLTRID